MRIELPGEGITAAVASDRMWPLAVARRAMHVLAGFARHKPLGCAGLIVLVAFALAGAAAPLLAPYGYDAVDFTARLEPPSRAHPLGTDQLGRDLLSRVLHGVRVSLSLAFGAVSLAVVLATAIAVVCGFYGGRTDLFVQRLVDIWLAVPALILLVSLVGVAGPGFWTTLVVVGLLNVPRASRIIRSVVIGVRHETYVYAARALGAGDARLIWRHLLPNILHILVYVATVTLGSAMLMAASLGFLGLGLPPPQPDLGGMLSGAGLQYMRRSPWLALWPGLSLTLIVFAFNVFGDALRDVLDPRLRGER